MEIPRLNIRQTLPRIGIRTKLSTLETHNTRAELHGDYQAPRSNMGWTQSTLEVNTYPSRHAYGYTNHEDFAREKGQEGIQKMREGMSRRNSLAQTFITNGAKKGSNVVAEHAKQEISAQISRQLYMDVQAIPDPEMHITPGRVTGQPDPGHYTTEAEGVETMAKSDFNRGSVEIYLQQKGDIRRWLTWGKYDTYA